MQNNQERNDPLNTPTAEDGTWLNKDDRMMAMLANLLGIFAGFIGPLVIYLVKKDESRFVAFHALQALYFNLMVLVVMIICVPLILIAVGFFLIPVAGVGALIYQILIAVKANEGKWDKYWLAGDWADSAIRRKFNA